jgi:hypothetical protein
MPGTDRRRHPRIAELRRVKLRFDDYALVFGESLDHSEGGLRLAHFPHFKPRVNDVFSFYDDQAMTTRSRAVVIAITRAGVHLKFAT